jgi:hypothetical protein
MRRISSHVRLILASWLLIGGLAVMAWPSAAGPARNARWRERQLVNVPAEDHAAWHEERDAEDARAEGYLRTAGVLVGGLGLAWLVCEAVYLAGRRGRRRRREGIV